MREKHIEFIFKDTEKRGETITSDITFVGAIYSCKVKKEGDKRAKTVMYSAAVDVLQGFRAIELEQYSAVISKETQELWDKIANELNGGGYYGQIVWNHGDKATLKSVLEKIGIESFMQEWDDQTLVAHQGFEEEMHDRTKDDFGSDPKELIDDDEKLEETLTEFLNSLLNDNPEFREVLEHYI